MTMSTGQLPSSGWYAVRCIFGPERPVSESVQRVYEERITLWRAPSIGEAIALAEAEAEVYAQGVPNGRAQYLGLAQAFELFEPPTHGSEVFSLLRSSTRDPDDYLDTHVDTGGEHQR